MFVKWLLSIMLSAVLAVAGASIANLIDGARSDAGLAPLTVDNQLTAYAESHAAEMAEAGEIYHSSRAELEAAAGSFTKLGENVGRGGSPDSIHQAFLDSPSHRANILGDYTHMGVGTAESNGVLYVAVVFKKAPSPTTTTTAPTTTSTDACGT